MNRTWFFCGAIITGLAVALGAFGAHGLQKVTDAKGPATWDTGVRYQAIHGLALLALALAAPWLSARSTKASGICFLAGTVIFSGSLYILVLSGIKWLGAITPVGGVLFLIGWFVLALASLRRQAVM